MFKKEQAPAEAPQWDGVAPRWEYRTQKLYTNKPVLVGKGEPTPNELGAAGWELVAVCKPTDPSPPIGYFKRPLAA